MIFKFLFADFFSVSPALPINAGWFGAPLGNAHYKGVTKTWIYVPRFDYSCLLIFCFTWRKRKWIELKATVKLNSKQTSIAMVRNLCRMFCTFLTPLLSRYQLPFKGGGGCMEFCMGLNFFRWPHFVLPSMSLIFLRYWLTKCTSSLNSHSYTITFTEPLPFPKIN